MISQSPEVFITEDNIINTQGSTEMDIDEPVKVADHSIIDPNNTASELGREKLEIPPEHERRRSDRLKKTATMSTMEKNQKMAQKRNLEGNPSTKYNSFSVLPIEELVHVTADMGVALDENDFDMFNLLKDLEKARSDLYQKQTEKLSESQTESVEIMQTDKNTLALEWMQDESSEDDFILVESRKKKRENRKKMLISPTFKGKKPDQENPGSHKVRGRRPKANSSITSKTKNHK